MACVDRVHGCHEPLKTFLCGRCGVATKYLGSYFTWYHLAILPKLSKWRIERRRL